MVSDGRDRGHQRKGKLLEIGRVERNEEKAMLKKELEKWSTKIHRKRSIHGPRIFMLRDREKMLEQTRMSYTQT